MTHVRCFAPLALLLFAGCTLILDKQYVPPTPKCEGLAAGTPCPGVDESELMICLDGQCVKSECGDGYVDARPIAGEECDETSAGCLECRWACAPGVDDCSAFIYVDVNYDGGGTPNGTREAPFRNLDVALQLARETGASGVIIGGSPTFVEPLRVVSGVSIHGGYGEAPGFRPSASQWPTFLVPSDAYEADANRLVGAYAEDVEETTMLRGIRIATANLTTQRKDGNGASNIGLLVRGGDGLVLENVVIEAGAAVSGEDGSDGAPPDASMNGGNAVGRMPGAAPAACNSACTDASPPAGQGSSACGYGGNAGSPGDDAYSEGATRPRGNHGASTPPPTGGVGGKNALSGGCYLAQEATAGGDGSPGLSGAAGADGGPAPWGELDAEGRWLVERGGDGDPGTRGTWGGGGGAGGGAKHDCMNDPDLGGHGGGGGAPGCGGRPGTGGGSGGASFAVVVIGGSITVRDSTLAAGPAGAGGSGGAGGAGGSGGLGADGMPPQQNVAFTEAKWGGAGGHGGAGGPGGAGGGGAGGDSHAIRCVDGAFAAERSTLTAANPATGGPSPVNAGPDGRSGESYGCGD